MITGHWETDLKTYKDYEVIFNLSVENKDFVNLLGSYKDVLDTLYTNLYQIDFDNGVFSIWADDHYVDSDGMLTAVLYTEAPDSLTDFYSLFINGMEDAKYVIGDDTFAERFNMLARDITEQRDKLVASTEKAVWVIRCESGSSLEIYAYDKSKGIDGYSSYKMDEEQDSDVKKAVPEELSFSDNQSRSKKTDSKPTKLSAAEEKKQWFIKDWKDGTLGIYGYKGDDSEITIPAQFGKKKVTTLFRSDRYPLYRNFSQNAALTKVIISDGIEKIEEKTFEWWFNPGLTEIVIPASVTVIEEQDFRFPEDITIYGPSGSCAERYAAEHGIAFVSKE